MAVDGTKFKDGHKDAQKVARLARKRAKDAEAIVDKSKQTVIDIEAEITKAKRDELPDEDRIIKRLQDELDKSYGFVDAMGGAAIVDLCVLQAAGVVGDAALRQTMSMIIAKPSRSALACSAVTSLANLPVLSE